MSDPSALQRLIADLQKVQQCAEALRIVDFNEHKQQFFCRACRYRDPLGDDGNKLHDDNCPWVDYVRAFKQLSDQLDALLVRPAREWQPTREGEAACLDCGLPYSAFPLDVNLPRAQWLDIHPDDGGLLCAACIVQRVKDRIPGVTVLHMVAEVTPAHQHDRSCRLNSWLNDGPCTCGNQPLPAPPGLAREAHTAHDTDQPV